MFTKDISYIDLDGNPVVEKYYFNMTKAEVLDLDFEYAEFGGLREYLKKNLLEIQNKKDTVSQKNMYRFFKDIIMSSVGKRSDDGKRFIKNEEISSYFVETGAFGEFLFYLMNEENAVVEFIESVLPAVDQSGRANAIEDLRKEGINLEGLA